MSCVQSKKITCLVAIAFAFAAGCGGSDETASAPDDEISNPVTPQGTDSLPEPGEPQANLESEAFPRVEFQTTVGTFTVKLHRERAPKTVDNFLTYVELGFYSGTIFHEVSPGYAVVGGGYTEEENGKLLEKDPGRVGIWNEAATGLNNRRGTIAMVREPQDADSAKCQFFFNLRDNAELDYAPKEEGVDVWQTAGYCAFGEVEDDGLQLLDEISGQDVTSRENMDRVPVQPVTIISARKL